MRKDKKGQAAMEFLMTYGWAILAAIVVIGILGYYYFGSDIMTPRSGVVQPPFYLNAHNVDGSTDTVNLELKNNGGESYDLANVSVSNCGSNATSMTLSSGESIPVRVDCTGNLTEGDSFEGDITIIYTKEDSELEQTSTGSVTDIVV